MSNNRRIPKNLFELPAKAAWDAYSAARPEMTLDLLHIPVAREVEHRRWVAFHEAGHLWAAATMGIPTRPSRTDRTMKKLEGPGEPETEWLALAGPMAQALHMVMYWCALEGSELQYDFRLETPVGTVAQHIEDWQIGGTIGDHFRYKDDGVVARHTKDPNLYWQAANAAIQPRFCLRGDDYAAAYLMLSEELFATNLQSTMTEFPYIESIAAALLEGRTVRSDYLKDLVPAHLRGAGWVEVR